MVNFFKYETEIGPLLIGESGGAVSHVLFNEEKLSPGAVLKETPFIRKVHGQIVEYLEGKRREFDLPLAPQGTEFQMKVWKALLEIPYGETRSYGQLAAAIGNPRAARAVGMANNRNPISIIVPCHRVIGAGGGLTGYGGGLPLKEKLLKLEGAL